MERFWDKTKIVNACIEWQAALYPNGYGCFKLNGKTVGAHRVAYEMQHGEIPEGLLVCHTCDNRKCVNQEHLFLGTYSDNMQDCSRKGRLVRPSVRRKRKEHGTSYSYKLGCRCAECAEANRVIRHNHYLSTGR